MQESHTATSGRKKNSPPPVKPDSSSFTGTESVFHHYQSAVQLLQQGKYERALSALEKLMPEAPAEIQDRCRIYINTCRRQLEKVGLTFPTPEEHYDYAISQLNTGYYEEAREEFNRILASYPNADYAYYGLALLEAITGHRAEPQKPAAGTRRQ